MVALHVCQVWWTLAYKPLRTRRHKSHSAKVELCARASIRLACFAGYMPNSSLWLWRRCCVYGQLEFFSRSCPTKSVTGTRNTGADREMESESFKMYIYTRNPWNIYDCYVSGITRISHSHRFSYLTLLFRLWETCCSWSNLGRNWSVKQKKRKR